MKFQFFITSFFLLIFLIAQSCASSESIFELDPAQSMSITGKGPGQDAAINPYFNEDSIGVIKNIGKNSFDIRIQNKAGEIVESVTINPKELKEVKLLKGYELYLDSDLKAKAKVTFRKME